MASEPASERAANADFSEQYLTELSSFNTNFRGFQSVLAALAADKGLANYNKNDQLETLLKATVNAVKDILGDTYEAIESIPGIGPLLGPTVYDIKCIIDEVLDATENLTDAIINDLVPLLRDLLGQATSTACEAGVEIVGLCLPL
ncbi:uncharacterized protein LAESUDRAFT_661393 [Laetiporus sulphureus 93-53]|uniref:Uncharacterized protein n=1 Tax=Laetiporus sulphureus 93-53 TaxID=1314785 RepID=A0A165CFP6_9APHY|nr:uncharacterized protein LAESUDRAFT_661393 [Laetiporus sulphureus 93-53]KZT02727.1 hypothetical protein LAESUDRAFT_661393 [Laetiporus sulphureus 93-53]